MSKPIRRGAAYYLRRRVPLDLVEHYGRREIVKALGTKDHHIAKVLCTAADDALNHEFAQARAALQTKTGTNPASWETLLPEEWGDPEDGTLAEEEREEELDRLADKIAARLGYSRAALGLTPSHIPATPATTARASYPTPAAPRPAIAASTEDRTLRTLVALWQEERKPDTRTASAYARAAERFRSLVGDIPVPAIRKADVVAFKDKLVAEGHSKITTRSSLSQLSTLLTFAMGRAWVENNAADGVTVTDKGKVSAKASRPPFDLATLNRLFSSKIYTEGFRAANLAGEAQFWLPLLGLYTGARIEELCQLRPSDIYEEEYRDANGNAGKAWVLRITADEDEGLGVKNAGSVRRIPIHPELIRLGFVEYCQQQTGSRIFPLLRKDKHGLESTAWSKAWMRDYFRKFCAPTSDGIVFHSFRHTFKDVCRQLGISKELADAIQGHTDSSASGGYGGLLYPLAPLVKAMSKYAVYGLTDIKG
ncbi:site-specific integrase [Caballeronia sp. INML1]|uniref:site-specific integrase n=1 Tax=Caballeronia sp. INML1 TaxID=2921760 RepID=UPI00202811A1|nr:site-specific integrase [Caballeronia sp. INML1]